MGQIVRPETLVFNLNQTPDNYPKEDNFNTVNHGESLKFNDIHFVSLTTCIPFHMGNPTAAVPEFPPESPPFCSKQLLPSLYGQRVNLSTSN
jgi:hypothetical protein